MKRGFAQRCCSMLGAAVLFCLLGGCRVTLISDYDATTDEWVTELQQTIDAHLSTLESLSGLPDPSSIEQCHPDRFSESYENIDARMRSLKLRNEARAANTVTIEQLTLLQSSIGKLREQQRTRYFDVAETSPSSDRCLSSEQVQINRHILEQHIRAVLKLEFSKRDFRYGG